MNVREEFERRYPNAMPILGMLEAEIQRQREVIRELTEHRCCGCPHRKQIGERHGTR